MTGCAFRVLRCGLWVYRFLKLMNPVSTPQTFERLTFNVERFYFHNETDNSRDRPAQLQGPLNSGQYRRILDTKSDPSIAHGIVHSL
jgi:hypothetical protein